MDDSDFLLSTGAQLGGEPIFRKVSSSHVMPRQLSDYQNFFRQSSNREDGYLDIKFNKSGEWQRKWVIFDEGILYYSDGPLVPLQDSRLVPMDTVISIRTDIYDTPGQTCLVVSIYDCKIFMRAYTTDDTRRWLFCFQKSVAMVLSHLLNEKTAMSQHQQQQSGISGNMGGGRIFQSTPATIHSNHHNYNSHSNNNNPNALSTQLPEDIFARTVSTSTTYTHSTHTSASTGLNSTTLSTTEEVKMWLGELGHGHGKHSAMVKKRSSFKDKDFTIMQQQQGQSGSSSSGLMLTSPSVDSSDPSTCLQDRYYSTSPSSSSGNNNNMNNNNKNNSLIVTRRNSIDDSSHDQQHYDNSSNIFNPNNNIGNSNLIDSNSNSNNTNGYNNTSISSSSTMSHNHNSGSTVDLTQLYMRESGQVLYGQKGGGYKSPSSGGSGMSGLSQSLSNTSHLTAYFNPRGRGSVYEPSSPNFGTSSNTSGVGNNVTSYALKDKNYNRNSSSSHHHLSNNTMVKPITSHAIPIVSSSSGNHTAGGGGGKTHHSNSTKEYNSHNNNSNLPRNGGAVMVSSSSKGGRSIHHDISATGLTEADSFTDYTCVIGHSQVLAGSYDDKSMQKTVLESEVVEERLRMLSKTNSCDDLDDADHHQSNDNNERDNRYGNSFSHISIRSASSSENNSNKSNNLYNSNSSNNNNKTSNSSNNHHHHRIRSDSMNSKTSDKSNYNNNNNNNNDEDMYMMFDMEDGNGNNNSNGSNTPPNTNNNNSSSSNNNNNNSNSSSQHSNKYGNNNANNANSNGSNDVNIRSSQLKPATADTLSFAAVAIDLIVGNNMNNNNNNSNSNTHYRSSQTPSSSSSSTSTPSGLSTSLRHLYIDQSISASSSSSSSSSSSFAHPHKTTITWESGYCTILGPRSKNEDRLVALPNLLDDIVIDLLPAFTPSIHHSLPPLHQGYFAVYDGHCGDDASSYLQRIFHSEVCKHEYYWNDLNRAITETCINLDQQFLQLCSEKKVNNCGTTALGLFLRDHQLTVYNIGDCSAVLSSAGGTVISLSDAHKPGRNDEKQRILAANGWVTEEQELYMGRLHRMDLSDPLVRDMASQVKFVTIHRVCGDLAVTRSIGDPDYKNIIPHETVKQWFQWPDNHTKMFNEDLIIPHPEIKNITLTDRDEFLVIASDGLWDVISSIDAVNIIRESFLKHKNKNASQVAEELCELALRLGSSDNVTVVIVQLIHS